MLLGPKVPPLYDLIQHRAQVELLLGIDLDHTADAERAMRRELLESGELFRFGFRGVEMPGMPPAREEALRGYLRAAPAMQLDQLTGQRSQPVRRGARAHGRQRMPPPGCDDGALRSQRQPLQHLVGGPAEPGSPRSVSGAERLEQRLEDLILVEEGERKGRGNGRPDGRLAAGGEAGDDEEARGHPSVALAGSIELDERPRREHFDSTTGFNGIMLGVPRDEALCSTCQGNLQKSQ